MEAAIKVEWVAGPLAVPYLGERWAQAALRIVETDEKLRAALGGARLSLLTIILHPPKDCYGFIYAAFDEAGLADYRVGHDYDEVTRDIDPPTFVVSGRYDIFAAVQRGELTERKALLSGQLHLTGSWARALRHMRALEAMAEALGAIDCKT